MGNIVGTLAGFAITIFFGAKDFLISESKQIKEDENGMEMLQFLIITAFVVVVAVALIYLLTAFIGALIGTLVGNS